jgi:uncharacterized metal-binding protein YceD (DUF177 family)
MATGLPDLVDCAHLALDRAVLDRVYELRDLPRLEDVLADPAGTLHARFAFCELAGGRLAAEVRIEATPQLVCQRCLQGFVCPVSGGSEVEFVSSTALRGALEEPELPERELYGIDNGRVSLRDLAEEEFLLAVTVAPKCSTPLTCGKALKLASGDHPGPTGETRRPFGVLQDLLKKT